MGQSVKTGCDTVGVFASAAANETDFGLLLSNQTGDQVNLTLDLHGAHGKAAIRLIDATHTDAQLAAFCINGDQQLQLELLPDALLWLGTCE